MFMAVLFIVAKAWKQPVSINRLMNTENVVYMCNVIVISFKKENPNIGSNIHETGGHYVK